MKNYFLPLFLLLSIAVVAAGTTDISVRVTDARNGVIPGANVTLTSRSGDRRTLTTDSSGSCRFSAVAPGEYLLQTAATGFDASTPKPVVLKSYESVNLTLSLGLAQV